MTTAIKNSTTCTADRTCKAGARTAPLAAEFAC